MKAEEDVTTSGGDVINRKPFLFITSHLHVRWHKAQILDEETGRRALGEGRDERRIEEEGGDLHQVNHGAAGELLDVRLSLLLGKVCRRRDEPFQHGPHRVKRSRHQRDLTFSCCGKCTD